eukprot:940740-Pyramimonas_sp.AAC.1
MRVGRPNSRLYLVYSRPNSRLHLAPNCRLFPDSRQSTPVLAAFARNTQCIALSRSSGALRLSTPAACVHILTTA